jgi:hypothetical protein
VRIQTPFICLTIKTSGRFLSYGPVCEGATWRSRYNEELYRLYDESDSVTIVRITRLRWAWHIVRMQDNLPCKKITLDKSEGRRRVGRPNLRWMDGVMRDADRLGVRNWWLRPMIDMVGGDFLSQPRPCMGCIAWEWSDRVVGSWEHDDGRLDSIKYSKLLDYMRTYHLLQQNSIPWTYLSELTVSNNWGHYPIIRLQNRSTSEVCTTSQHDANIGYLENSNRLQAKSLSERTPRPTSRNAHHWGM